MVCMAVWPEMVLQHQKQKQKTSPSFPPQNAFLLQITHRINGSAAPTSISLLQLQNTFHLPLADHQITGFQKIQKFGTHSQVRRRRIAGDRKGRCSRRRGERESRRGGL